MEHSEAFDDLMNDDFSVQLGEKPPLVEYQLIKQSRKPSTRTPKLQVEQRGLV